MAIAACISLEGCRDWPLPTPAPSLWSPQGGLCIPGFRRFLDPLSLLSMPLPGRERRGEGHYTARDFSRARIRIPPLPVGVRSRILTRARFSLFTGRFATSRAVRERNWKLGRGIKKRISRPCTHGPQLIAFSTFVGVAPMLRDVARELTASSLNHPAVARPE
jgi:hypothetical protein